MFSLLLNRGQGYGCIFQKMRCWTLKLITGHAKPVLTVINDEFRAAGLYQQDQWGGRNGRGIVVQNGVYIAELTVVYQDGTKDRIRRKVAVVR